MSYSKRSVVPGGFAGWCERHYRRLSLLVLALAAFNLLYRLASEVVTEWDESLYAITAFEAATQGNWIGTTFFGRLDYYNSKPPLNVWLIGLAFKTFGTSLLSLRLASVTAAFITVAVLQAWSRRLFGAATGLLAGAVLGTSFGFLYVHSARSGNPDALLACVILLTVVTLWAARERPWVRLWLGPLAAAAFLLKGAAVVLPLAIVAGVEIARRRSHPVAPRIAIAAGLLFVLPIAAWAAARWQVDGPAFFQTMVANDLVAISVRTLEGHTGSIFYYVDELQKNHYQWLVVAALAAVLIPWSRTRLRTWLPRRGADLQVLVGVWAAVLFLVPTAMQTKLAWYLNPFYPVFALGVAWLVGQALELNAGRRGRLVLLASVTVLAFVAAEGRLIWYSHTNRDLARDEQGVILEHGALVSGRRIFKPEWDLADRFVLMMVGATPHAAQRVEEFVARSVPGDLWLARPGEVHPKVTLRAATGSHALYERLGAGDRH